MKIYNDNGDEMVLVLKSWFDYQKICSECPYCGSNNCIEDPESDEFESRKGCGDCNQWFEPVLCKPK